MIQTTVEIDEEEIIREIADEYLETGLEDRGYIVIDPNQGIDSQKRQLIDFLNSVVNSSLNYHASDTEILEEISEII